MKTMIRTLVLIIGLVAFAGTASAQKFAHVNTDSLMNELYLKDSLQQKLEAKAAEYEAHYMGIVDEIEKERATLNKKKTTPDMPPSVIALQEKKVYDLENSAQLFQQEANREIQAYELKLTEPIVNKLKKAIDDVAKEKGYTYVINAQVLLVSPPSDDITNLVRKKLAL